MTDRKALVKSLLNLLFNIILLLPITTCTGKDLYTLYMLSIVTSDAR